MILIKLLRKLTRSRRQRIFFFGIVGLAVMLAVSTFGFWLIEHEQNLSLFDSLWLSYVTMTTVGYGDKSPLTTAGRVFAMLVAMTGGIGLVAYVITLMASTIIEWENKRMKGLNTVKCSDHYMIVNCPNQEKVLTMIEEIRRDPWSRDVPIVLISEHLKEIPDLFTELSDFYFVSGNPLAHQNSRACKRDACSQSHYSGTRPQRSGLGRYFDTGGTDARTHASIRRARPLYCGGSCEQGLHSAP